MQVQLGPLFRQLALAGLGNQDNGSGQQGAEPHEALEPKYHIPPGLVVDRWASNGENGSHRHFLFRQDGWTMVRHQISKEITSVISTAWYFTTHSGGIWFGQDAAKGRVMEIVTRTVRDEEHMRYSCVAYLSLTVTIGGVNK